MLSCASLMVFRIVSMVSADASSLERMSSRASCTFSSCSLRRLEIADNASSSFVWNCSVSVVTLLRCCVANFMKPSIFADMVCASEDRVLLCVVTAFMFDPNADDFRSMRCHK